MSKICKKCNFEFEPNSNCQKYCNSCRTKRKKRGRPNIYPLHVGKLLEKYHSKYLQDLIRDNYNESLGYLKFEYEIIEHSLIRIKSMNEEEYAEYIETCEYDFKKKIWHILQLKTALKCLFIFIKDREHEARYENLSGDYVTYDDYGNKIYVAPNF